MAILHEQLVDHGALVMSRIVRRKNTGARSSWHELKQRKTVWFLARGLRLRSLSSRNEICWCVNELDDDMMQRADSQRTASVEWEG